MLALLTHMRPEACHDHCDILLRAAVCLDRTPCSDTSSVGEGLVPSLHWAPRPREDTRPSPTTPVRGVVPLTVRKPRQCRRSSLHGDGPAGMAHCTSPRNMICFAVLCNRQRIEQCGPLDELTRVSAMTAVTPRPEALTVEHRSGREDGNGIRYTVSADAGRHATTITAPDAGDALLAPAARARAGAGAERREPCR
jgi:hypothetical protein